MNIKFLGVFLFCFIHIVIVSQNTNQRLKDSLFRFIDQSKYDTLRAKGYLSLSNMFFGSDADSIEFYSNKSLSIIGSADKADPETKLALLGLKADALNNRGYAYCHLGDNLKGLVDYEESIKIRERLSNKLGIAESLNNIAVVYDENGDAAKAIDYYLRSLKLLEEIDEKYGMGYIFNNIAFVYKSQGDVGKASDYAMRSLKIRKQINDKKGEGESLSLLGLIEAERGDLDSALEKFKTSLEISTELGSKIQSANALLDLGKIYLKKKDYSRAMDYFHQSLGLSEEIKEVRAVINSYLALAEAYLEMRDLEAATVNAKKAMTMNGESNHPEIIQSAAELLQKIYKEKGDYKQAFEMYELYIQMKDSILRDENKRASVQKEFQYLYEKKAATDSIRNAEQIKLEEVKHEQEISRQRSYTYGGIAGFGLMLLVAGVSYNAFRNKKKANQEIQSQKLLIEEKQKEIVDSINYAKRIQYALLANEKMFSDNLTSCFILFKPKDIVSGDFYWAYEKNGKFFLAVCDCTGHGVPGAFMSLLNISFLNEAVNERNLTEPHTILNYVRQRLIENLSDEGTQDGMDGCILCIDKASGKHSYSAAYNAPVLIRNNELVQLPADKMPVGKGIRNDSFTSHIIETQKGDVLYFYTDGYADQFGGFKGKKFKYKQLNEFLISVHELDAEDQKKQLEKVFNDWKGNLEQIDDVCIIGLRIPM